MHVTQDTNLTGERSGSSTSRLAVQHVHAETLAMRSLTQQYPVLSCPKAVAPHPSCSCGYLAAVCFVGCMPSYVQHAGKHTDSAIACLWADTAAGHLATQARDFTRQLVHVSCRGYGLVSFTSEQDMLAAIQGRHSTILGERGRVVSVRQDQHL